MGEARYDGLADWYEKFTEGGRSQFALEAGRLLRELVGPGSGRCLDLGCGGGIYLPLLLELGWSVVGLDVSSDQLRVAAARVDDSVELVRGDATDLPFGDASFDAVAAVLVSTDIEPWETVVAEAARVLRVGGAFVNVGLHPCFVGPHTMLREEDRARILGSGYRDRVHQDDSPAFHPSGVRTRVGAVHVPLDDLVNALVEQGFELERLLESREADPPGLLGVRATMRATQERPSSR